MSTQLQKDVERALQNYENDEPLSKQNIIAFVEVARFYCDERSDFEKRLAELEDDKEVKRQVMCEFSLRMDKLEATRNIDKRDNLAWIINNLNIVNSRLSEIESQVCGAKKGRMEKLDERVNAIEIQLSESTNNILFGEQPDGTVTSGSNLSKIKALREDF